MLLATEVICHSCVARLQAHLSRAEPLQLANGPSYVKRIPEPNLIGCIIELSVRVIPMPFFSGLSLTVMLPQGAEQCVDVGDRSLQRHVAAG